MTTPNATIDANPAWYHTIDLPGGGDPTPGHVDWRGHSARLLDRDLHGLHALDVGTYDGFWAFELERRGAEVVAIDLDRLDAAAWPPVHRARLTADADAFGLELGRGFRIAHRRLGSRVQRVVCDVLALTPDAVGGRRFDLAFLGALLLHLRDPIRALENIRSVLVPGGRLIMLEAISLTETVRAPRTPLARFDTAANAFNWWLPNVAALHDYLWAAGFVEIERISRPLRPPAVPSMRCWYCAFSARAPARP
ncbi:methyltransferase domain-containing protein [Conexibacter sp. DBS9H8]|uniref:class I SAM-dependent methyltransferase n=1 Tax=Conexibacter sp. DBS9H8 TaxID=2937801 RepID=UPI00200CD7B6|nr:methyltransferase domain-containing protein [Conexibacter sp. DBS9H8]